jgi:uncharacterized protein
MTKISSFSLILLFAFSVLTGFNKDSNPKSIAERQPRPPSPVIHFEIGCKDIAKTTAFYTSLFGWTPTSTTMASYINTNSTEGIQGHIASLGHEPFNYVTIYIQVEDIADQLQKIQAAGGQKIVGPIKLPTGQQFAWFKDLDGNLVGLLTKPKT